MSQKLPFSIVTDFEGSNDRNNERLHLLEADRNPQTKKWYSRLQYSYIWIWSVILLILFVLIVYALNPSRDSDSFPVSLLNSGDRIQLKSLHSELYIRVSDATSSLVLDQTIPWRRGSTFEVEAAGECFLLKSLTGNFVRVDSEGVIRSNSEHRYGATHFTAITKYESQTIPAVDTLNGGAGSMQVHLKVCKQNRWLQEVSQLSATIAANKGKEDEIGGTEGDISGDNYTGHDSDSVHSSGNNMRTHSTKNTASTKSNDIYTKSTETTQRSQSPSTQTSDSPTSASPPKERLPVKSTNMIVTAPVETKAMSWGKPSVSTGKTYRSTMMHIKNRVTDSITGMNEGLTTMLKISFADSVTNRLQRLVGGTSVTSASTDYSSGSTDYSAGSSGSSDPEEGSVGSTGKVGMRNIRPLLSSFEVISVPQIRGVNLGGWFIPEVWMGSAFFNGTGLGWGGSLCSMVNYSRSLTEERMAERLQSWITEGDLREIKAMGFNSVRLPIGYWNVINDPYQKYAPGDHRVSLRYIDWCFDTCEKLGLTVLLDLHGAPGSQNGIDHSGCSMYPRWIRPENIAMTLQAIEAMAKRYSGRKNLLGFELLNEPAENYGALNDFYVKSYHIVRRYSQSALVIFNELYAKQYSAWNRELREPNYFNIMVDWHLYQFQYPHFTQYQHVAAARAWEQTIEQYDSIHPIIIGEWSMGTGPIRQAGQPYVDAAVKSFERSSGWYLWNWKVQHGIGFEEWDVQAQYAKKGLDPLRAVRQLNEENRNFLLKGDPSGPKIADEPGIEAGN